MSHGFPWSACSAAAGFAAVWLGMSAPAAQRDEPIAGADDPTEPQDHRPLGPAPPVEGPARRPVAPDLGVRDEPRAAELRAADAELELQVFERAAEQVRLALAQITPPMEITSVRADCDPPPCVVAVSLPSWSFEWDGERMIHDPGLDRVADLARAALGDPSQSANLFNARGPDEVWAYRLPADTSFAQCVAGRRILEKANRATEREGH